MSSPRTGNAVRLPRRSLRQTLHLALLLTLFTACFAARSASAQSCADDGTELTPGLVYIESHAWPDRTHAVIAVASDPLAGKLLLNDSENSRTTIDILNVDCKNTAAGTGWQGDTRMWIYCLEGELCVQDEARASASDEWAPRGAARNSASYVTAPGDTSSTAALSQTFSHVIYLLQKQYNTMHIPSNLPVPAGDR